MSSRQIVLDTETTGLETSEGHRVIEIGCVELVDRKYTHNNFHYYLNPDRDIDVGAIEIHGITSEFLKDKPRFPEVQEQFFQYINGAELVIHNAAFDVGFIEYEYSLLNGKPFKLSEICTIVDSLQVARKLHPGQKNNLDALCKRYFIDNSQRTLHGALLDAEILADVYLMMTGGQTSLSLNFQSVASEAINSGNHRASNLGNISVHEIQCSDDDDELHNKWVEKLGEQNIWN